MLTFFHDDVGTSWGVAIILLTFVTRIVILPLSLKQIRSMRSLQAHQPDIKRIQEKYKDDRQRMQREMMDFYRENKINPFASCVPLLLQLPVFLALFYLLRSDEFKDEIQGDPSFLGIPDLSETATGTALVVLIVLYFVTMVGSTSIMAASAEGSQRWMMYALPVFFTPVHHQLPGGADRLLDHDQPVDDGPAVGGQAGDPAAAEADRGRSARRRSPLRRRRARRNAGGDSARPGLIRLQAARARRQRAPGQPSYFDGRSSAPPL